MTPRSPRRIGSLEVSGIGLGCMGMSFAYGPADQDEALATLHHALDTGITLLDTADMYGGGANEKLLSTVLADRRDEIVLATKFGILTDPDTGLPSGVDGSPDYVRRCVDASLQRLGVDVIDLYYLHRVDPTRPIEETVGAMADLVAAGKVRELGLSEAGADTLRRASAVHPIAALQSEWSLFSRDIETADVPAARELGVTVVPYSPLGRGMLTGSA
ncbi:aldo/keto reductase, partial [Gordonia sp. i37]|uniref:aldo/keto reductase n=1 Tax=Gordonia sp. i37 TaxID=1961707 RepID=UPI0009ADB7BA